MRKIIILLSIALALACSKASHGKNEVGNALVGAAVSNSIYWGLTSAGCKNKWFKLGTSIVGATLINSAISMGNDDSTQQFEHRFKAMEVGTILVIPLSLFDN